VGINWWFRLCILRSVSRFYLANNEIILFRLLWKVDYIWFNVNLVELGNNDIYNGLRCYTGTHIVNN